MEWTDAEREAAAGALRKSRLTWGTHSDRWGDTPWQRGFWGEAADTVLEALAPFVAGREERLRAKVARVEALTGGPLSDGYRPYGVQVGREVHMAVLLDDLRAALADRSEP